MTSAPSSQDHIEINAELATPDHLAHCLQALKPGGKLMINSTIPESALLVAGFIKIANAFGVTVAYKPSYEMGQQQLRRKPKAQVPLNLNDDDEGEIIDENSLLTEQDYQKPTLESLKSNCETKNKACKDCSCGRAELEAAAQADVVTTVLPKSSCGSCYLGDAFRCSGCPYSGMPAFKPGEKVTLSNAFMDDDI